LIVGVFSPVINWCGGAECVAIGIINALKEHGHQVVILSDSPIDKERLKSVFNRNLPVDNQIIFPFRFFPSTDLKNIYTDAIRTLILKSKCQVVVDTFSNAVLPGSDVSYVHHPLLRRVEVGAPYLRNKLFFMPYQSYLKFYGEHLKNKLVLANSKFTADAIKAETGLDAQVLYPPVMNEINPQQRDFEAKRENNVITVGRICVGKNLTIIPHIAKLTRKGISFTIAGLLESQDVIISLNKLSKELNVADRIRILTNVKRDQLKNILMSSKVYLHPKVNEHFGISIVEAMSLGCTPIVHDSGGPKEFVPQSQRYNTPEEAAKEVERAIDNWSPTQARKLSKDADKFSEQNFSNKFMNIFSSRFNGDSN
jgi:alpha-1,2-mannosyltransferase